MTTSVTIRSISQQHFQQNQWPQNLAPIQQHFARHSNIGWEYAFIPHVSKWSGKPLCADEFDKNETCCASRQDMEVVLVNAHKYGLEDHPGVKAIKDRPCASAMDLRELDDELRYFNYLKSEKPKSTSIPGAPNFIDINDATEAILDRRILRYCSDLLHSTLKHSYGKLESIPQQAKLGENFKAVIEYCSDVVIGRLPIFDLLTNHFTEKK